MNIQKIVIKIGGSLLFSDGNINTQKLSEFCRIVKKNITENSSVIIICGGGTLARTYINAVRKFGGNDAICDTFGIDVSRINSKLVISNLKDVAYPQVPKNIEELSIALLFKKIIVMGGLQPGQSTTSVAVEVAEYIDANEIIILTDVDGVYNKDPNKFKDAQLLKKLSYTDAQELFLGSSNNKQSAAGEYRILDAVSLQILKRSNIKVVVISGKNLNEFNKILGGEKEIIGTIISN